MAKARKRRAARSRRSPRDPAIPITSGDNTTAPIDLSVLRAPLETIGRSFALIALRFAPVRPKTTQERALFLKALGLSVMEIATILKSTPRSIGELISRARRK
jgi:hypothetical protein